MKILAIGGCGSMARYALKAAQNFDAIDEIIIATSDLPQDDIIEQIAIENNVSVFRGSENDVLSRYYFCAKNPTHLVFVIKLNKFFYLNKDAYV